MAPARMFAGLGVVLLALTGARSEAAPPWKRAPELAISPHGDPILAPVAIGGRTRGFLVDTGASGSVFDTRLRESLGKRRGFRQVSTAGEATDVEVYSWPDGATIAGLPAPRGGPAMAMDLTELRAVCGQPISGAVGMDFLRNRVLELDFDSGEMRFRPAVEPSQPPPGEAFPLVLDRSNTPWLKADVAGRSETFLLDTGANASSLTAGLLDGLLEAGQARLVGSTRKLTAGGDVEARQARISSLRLGPFEHRDLLLQTNRRHSTLGLDYLSRYRVTLDFPNRTLYLTPGRQYARLDQPDMSGLRLLWEDPSVVVDDVEPEKPAAIAGVEPRDELLAIDGQPADDLGLFALRRLLRSAHGRILRLTLQRGRRTFDVELTLYSPEAPPAR